jgi:hypothetical protein
MTTLALGVVPCRPRVAPLTGVLAPKMGTAKLNEHTTHPPKYPKIHQITFDRLASTTSSTCCILPYVGKNRWVDSLVSRIKNRILQEIKIYRSPTPSAFRPSNPKGRPIVSSSIPTPHPLLSYLSNIILPTRSQAGLALNYTFIISIILITIPGLANKSIRLNPQSLITHSSESCPPKRLTLTQVTPPLCTSRYKYKCQPHPPRT